MPLPSAERQGARSVSVTAATGPPASISRRKPSTPSARTTPGTVSQPRTGSAALASPPPAPTTSATTSAPPRCATKPLINGARNRSDAETAVKVKGDVDGRHGAIYASPMRAKTFILLLAVVTAASVGAVDTVRAEAVGLRF